MQEQAAHKPTIKLGCRPNVFHIESDDVRGRFYTVDALRLSCSCMAGQHGRRCWHIAYAVQYETWRTVQSAKAAAPMARPSGMVATERLPVHLVRSAA